MASQSKKTGPPRPQAETQQPNTTPQPAPQAQIQQQQQQRPEGEPHVVTGIWQGLFRLPTEYRTLICLQRANLQRLAVAKEERALQNLLAAEKRASNREKIAAALERARLGNYSEGNIFCRDPGEVARDRREMRRSSKL